MAKKNNSSAVKYSIEKNGTFVIENYNQAKPFSNFFPGIAGVWGIPMWAFYVNRGQCISSFGIESKDRAILEFLPANKAYRQTASQGFRTFIKVKNGTKSIVWEPFQGKTSRMAIMSHDLTISDENLALGLKVEVNYFTLANEPFPALIRRVTLTNISKKTVSAEVIDGLPLIIPYGMRDWVLKNMSRTVEAWVKVKNLKAKAPFYHLNVEVADTPDVQHIKEGNFFFAFTGEGAKAKLLDPIIEAAVVFGSVTDYGRPERFIENQFTIPSQQQFSNRTPSAMAHTTIKLAAKAQSAFVSVVGHTFSEEHLKTVLKTMTAPNYIARKCAENKDLVEEVKGYARTISSSASFDAYCGQTFLDNILRGGLPVTVKTADGKVALNVYSRKHGDPERDYNYFVLSPTYFSQGNGNFRDVNQNRRNDVWFNPHVKDSAIIDFFNLSQADGYNPLIVKGTSFALADPEHLEEILQENVNGECEALRILLQKSFQPGEVLKCVVEKGIKLRVKPSEFLEHLLSHCQRQILADHGEGFWADHWTYNLDLVESYLGVYPEHGKTLLMDKKIFSFYHNSHYLVARTERYVLTEKGVRQYHAVVDGTKEIRAHERGNKLRVNGGEGEVYHTNLLVKMLCLITNKAASFDPSGVGLEMEGDKPNWYDALNGLPGLLGSSISETMELKRIAQFLLDNIEHYHLDNEKVPVFVELADFMKELRKCLENEKDPAGYWHKANDAKEHYRLKIRKGIDGSEAILNLAEIRAFLKAIVERCRIAKDHAKTTDGLLSTYFYHEVTEHAKLDRKSGNLPNVLPLTFKRHALPLFLEGFVHALKVEKDPKQARDLYQRIRQSDLFDKKLKMYRVNANISSQTEEIGRTRIFPRGWLENESIWLHMQYKYFLEVLRSGLYEEFFSLMQESFIPFLKPEVYGRSILENSSFIASSSHEDQDLHGQGFVARLSGSTAELLHMWLIMNAGPKPFQYNNRTGLTLHFQPTLPSWLFTKEARQVSYADIEGEIKTFEIPKDSYAFSFLGTTLVLYRNPGRKNTFGPKAAVIKEITISYFDSPKPVHLKEAVIPATYAQEVRDNKVEKIEIFLE